MRFLSTLLFCFVATRFSAAAPQRKTPPPDIYLITIDTLRADHVRCYGYEHIQTPAMDALANNGIRFANAFTPSPITNTSHTSILTGLLPRNHGVTDFGIPLSPAHSTWAQLLHAQGYHTGAFIGAVILDSKSLAPGLDRGFDYYDNFPHHASTKSRWGRLERRAGEVVQHTEAWLNKHTSGPNFVWMHLYDPHDPYEPPPPYSATYKNHLYDGEIAYADSALASFIVYLKRRGRYENAVIIVVGDHGEGLGEHHEDTHGIFLYDSTTHVPMIIKMPFPANSIRRKIVDSQVRTIDLLPTILDLLHISSPPPMDGQSLGPLLAGNESTQRLVFGETDYPLRFGWAPLRSVRANGAKFIEAPRSELYDISTDPGELENEYAPWDNRVKESRALLAEARAKAPPQEAPKAVSQQTVDELQALGYLGRADLGSSTNVPEPSLLPDPKDKIEEQNLLHAAMMASEDNRIPVASEFFEKALRLDPQSSAALRQLGELELRTGQNAKAAEHLKAALELNPDDANVALGAAQAMEKTRDLEGARRALDTSLKLKPSQLAARLLLGRVYIRLGKPALAQDQFEAAMLLQAGNEDAALGLAEAQIEQGKFAGALDQLATLSRSHNPHTFDLKAQALAQLGKPKEAHLAAARAQALRQLQTQAKPTLPQ